MKRFGLSRHQKLKSRTAIDDLFRGGQRFSVFPVLLWHRVLPAGEEPAGVQTGFSCSKKHFKKAVDRNRIKRLMREAWRLQKPELEDWAAERNIRLHVFLVFLDKTLPVYTDIYAAVGKGIRQLKKKAHEAAQ